MSEIAVGILLAVVLTALLPILIWGRDVAVVVIFAAGFLAFFIYAWMVNPFGAALLSGCLVIQALLLMLAERWETYVQQRKTEVKKQTVTDTC
jgi:hypothetical protein